MDTVMLSYIIAACVAIMVGFIVAGIVLHFHTSSDSCSGRVNIDTNDDYGNNITHTHSNVDNDVRTSKNKVRRNRKKVTKSKLRDMDKNQLISMAKLDFNIDLDYTSTKTNLINKVYELHNKK